MTIDVGIDWADAFQNSDYISDANDYPPKWEASAKAFRETANARLDLPYGDGSRERLDLFLPETSPRGLMIFVHGGYWMDFGKSDWSHLAQGPLHHGWAVAMPGYTLAPQVQVPHITSQVARAIEAAAGEIGGDIRLAGHSAGGHLATRMICRTGPLDPAVQARIVNTVSISGLHDLRPIQAHPMNDILRLTPKTALSESAACHAPCPGTRVVAWVGAGERPEFLRQAALLAEAWGRAGADARLVAAPDRNHFSVVEDLADPESALVATLMS